MLLKGSSEDILVQVHFKYSRNKQYADLLINIPIPIVSSNHIHYVHHTCTCTSVDYIQYNVSYKTKKEKQTSISTIEPAIVV